ncbi:tRNA pseudouridine(38-40) synthase TruA [Roseibacillus ishigakijimensis]|uniref:tRNA pseudouridine synthase A n=1 Tax=Roseibacillus ishigakijimensis TaxID=454146 RepID=A0A934RRQ7_9BACT|nr:tRNA pseudouridine(38-40) synthase TruA [Roseibacillus ishigakijimensis]MBK1833316.1 tRNA pseudouridine(38-40) synthase TruA [Roseibacillus ishigakijimensis]
MRLKLTLAYDGRPYAGYATQPNGDTVQDRLEAALAEVVKQPLRVHHAGRTDAGVHAVGQIVHFDAPEGSSMNPFNYLPALNSKLPPTIRVMACEEVAADFHARFSAKEKTYQYRLSLAPVLPPLDAGLAWHLPRQLDPLTLEDALARYLGEHDFRNFAAKRGNETADTNYHRTLTHSGMQTTPEGYLLTFTGNGFLYKMVRLLTGAAVQAAQGRLRLDEIDELLTATPPGRPPLCAPPDGLTLLEVTY